MSDYEVGYGKPPIHSRFKAGNNANPEGRPKRGPFAKAEIIHNVLSETTQYSEGGQPKKATRQELAIMKVLSETLKGDMKAAVALLGLYAHAQKVGDAGVQVITVHEWQPDYPGQTAEEKTSEFTSQGNAVAPEWWKESDGSPTDESS
jgi:Family of unknown function (DUF5681)